jgi:DNA repair protein SbcD/Mre11
MKILHTADLHIDSPMRGLGRYEGAPVEKMRSATRRAAENIVDLALRERVDVVTIGGDVFDGPWPDVNTGLWWNRQLDRLVGAGIEVYVVHGNHDAESLITQRIAPPSGVHVFSAEVAESVRSSRLPLVVHGRSYRDRATVDDLASTYPNAVPGVFNLGLLHTSLDGRPGHGTYAPCTIDTLVAKGYAFWGLGHVHEREEVPAGRTLVLFPGNTQGRSVREVGAKSVSIIFTNDTEVVDVNPVEVDVVRWARLELDISGLRSEDELYAGALKVIADARRQAGRPLAVRLSLNGTGPLRRMLLERHETIRANLAAKLSSTEGDVWVEKLKDETRAERVVGAAETSAVTAVRELLEEAMHDEGAARSLAGVLPDVQRRLGGVLGRLEADDGPASLTDVEFLRSRLPQAAELLIARLEER